MNFNMKLIHTTTLKQVWHTRDFPVKASAEVAVGLDPVSVGYVTATPEMDLVLAVSTKEVSEKRKWELFKAVFDNYITFSYRQQEEI